MSCGCVVLYGGSGAGGVRGALDDQGHWVRGSQGCSRLDGCGAGASVYLGPGAEAACRNASTAAGCPGSPCPTCPPRSCNTTYCSQPREKTTTGDFFPSSSLFSFILSFRRISLPNLSLSLSISISPSLSLSAATPKVEPSFHASFEVFKDRFP